MKVLGKKSQAYKKKQISLPQQFQTAFKLSVREPDSLESIPP